MEISFNEVENIVKTLPIGLYLKRRIELGMDKDSDTSYYVPMEDRVGISYSQIAGGLEKVTDRSFIETAVRTSVYHEVSHAFLTPKIMDMEDIYNIFEDERIETLLANYYLDTNFKKNVFYINGFTSRADLHYPKDAMDAFYQLVRFRQGYAWADLLAEVDKIIIEYKHLNNASGTRYGHCDYSKGGVYDYEYAIRKLYDEVCKRFGSTPPPSAEGEGTGTGTGSGGKFKDDIIGGGKPMSESESAGNSSPSDETFMDGGHSKVAGELTEKDIKDLFEKASSVFVDTGMQNTLETIISNFNKKNNGGSAINSYSGRFNPRAVARDDYRYFEKALPVNGNNRYGTCHLNLFIDKSGSFMSSETVVNTLLKALTNIEKHNRNFTLDVVFCGHGEKVCKTIAERQIKCGGGNCLDKEIFPIFKKLQKNGTCNYNIVLFDGDAFSDGGKQYHSFKAFDTNNTTIISDTNNKLYLDEDVKRAKVIYTNDYTQELIKNITRVLEVAFR